MVDQPNQKQDTFCVELWTALDVSYGGIVRPCCSFKDIAKENDRPVRIADVTAQEALESESFKDWRSDALAGKPLKGCALCYSKERACGTSDRVIFNRAYEYYHAGMDPRIAFQSPKAEGPDAQGPDKKSPSVQRLTLHLGNVCNLKCRTCVPTASSRIAADRVHRSWAVFDNPKLKNDHRRPTNDWDWAEDEEIMFGRVLHQLDTLESLQLSGGEPLVMPPVRSILSEIVRRGAASHLRLAIPSNGTRLDDRMLDLLSEFKEVRIRISVDGVGTVNEYIRFPSVWTDVEETVEKLKRLPNAVLAIGFTLSAYNIFEPARVAAWASAQRIKFEYGIVEQPTYLAANVLPSEVLRRAADRAEQGAETIKHQQMAHEVRAIANHLKLIADRHFPDLFGNFVAFTNDLDNDRGQHFAQALPELPTVIEESVGPWDKHQRKFDPAYFEGLRYKLHALSYRIRRWLTTR